MPTWRTRQKLIAIANYKKKTYRELSEKLGKSETAISLFLCSQGVVKCRNYTETETYLLQNFPARQCAQFIPHKSLNAIKIKQSRLRAQLNCPPVFSGTSEAEGVVNHHQSHFYASV